MKGFIRALGLVITLLAGTAQAQDYAAPLYPGRAPGSEHWQYEAYTHQGAEGVSRYNTREPRIEVHLPSADRANGAAIVMLPGGGLRVLGLGADQREAIALFNAEGVAVIVLEYRTLQLAPAELARATAPRPAGAAPGRIRFPKLEIRDGNANPAPDDAGLNEVLRLAVADGQEALRQVRARAAEWRIDPTRVGMIGTSAGGGVAFGTMMAGEAGATPDYIVSIFGPALQDVAVPERAPPLFLVTESNHGPVTDGLVALFQMWKWADQPAELHAYEVENFSMRVGLWGDRLFDWMRERGLLPARQQ